MQSKTFCELPWYSEEINGLNKTPCCLLAKGYDITQVKKDLLSDVPSKSCQKCMLFQIVSIFAWQPFGKEFHLIILGAMFMLHTSQGY